MEQPSRADVLEAIMMGGMALDVCASRSHRKGKKVQAEYERTMAKVLREHYRVISAQGGAFCDD